jgi:uncharacterized membrane protein
MQSLAVAVTFVALLLSGAIAGFFYAYSCSVMWGLDTSDPRAAIDAMQRINIVVRNAAFFPAFFGTPVVALAAAGLWLSQGRRDVALLLALAAAIYLVGAFLTTLAVNVPMNEALGRTAIPTDAEAAAAIWRDYSAPWTRWNHVRTAASLAALAMVGWALHLGGRAGAG